MEVRGRARGGKGEEGGGGSLTLSASTLLQWLEAHLLRERGESGEEREGRSGGGRKKEKMREGRELRDFAISTQGQSCILFILDKFSSFSINLVIVQFLL